MIGAAFRFRPEQFVPPRRRPPPQTGRMTHSKLTQLIKAGYGQGHLADYKPWLRVTKHDYSPSSYIGYLNSPEFGHTHHYRSAGERNMLVFLKWLGAADLRDQYPAWPWGHHHPACGLPDVGFARRSRGLLCVAEELGIRHGVYPGTDIPYVATIDILATWKKADGSYGLTAHDCKPKAKIRRSSNLDRLKQRLLLIQAYCEESGIEYRLTHPERLPPILRRNLDALNPLLRPDQEKRLRLSHEYELVLQACTRWGYANSPHAILDDLAYLHGVNRQTLDRALHLALWRQDLDHDLGRPLELYRPLILGGRRLRAAMHGQWVGGEQ